ncbi:hypothetical protein [Abyssisolibacter fermentans]|uniref:hypothetical protein n=1 Tax=Abyssisolibacter fermentans TaxID=1766203 RepID=UPI00082BA041|nr:hypothetical protein [Abyssisolibacter fermentans]
MDFNIQYPEIYYRIHPSVVQCIMRYFSSYNALNQMPDEDQLSVMVDEVYSEVVREYPEINKDIKEQKSLIRTKYAQNRPYYGRKRLLKDIISIIIIGELMKRRRPPYYRPYYGPYYGY